MYLKSFLEKYNDKKIKLFVDMDGVIVDYIFGSPNDYDKKRPLYDSINKLKEISNMPNIELFIFSITRYNEGEKQKQDWLSKNAPFFKEENRIIISREENDMEKSSILKANYMKTLDKEDSIIIVIDDDPRVLKEINSVDDSIILLKDTALVD